jgi:hypothetical protein
MTAYVTSPFKPPVKLLTAGTPSYLVGSYDDRSSPTFGYVISDSGVTTTATLKFRIVSGNAPAAGDLITVVGTSNDSGHFNVTNVALVTATTTDDGICTVTYAKTSGTVGTATDAGQVTVPRIEIGEALANGASISVAAPFNNPVIDQGKAISVTAKVFGTIGGSLNVTVALQGADFDVDTEYQDIDTILTWAGGALDLFQNGHWVSGQTVVDPTVATENPGGVNQSNYRFYRVIQRGVGGAAGNTLVVKIEC